MSDEENRVLLIKSPRRGWELPGGQVEEGESVVEAAKREVFEETGFYVTIGRLAGLYTAKQKAQLVLCFLVQKDSGTATVSAESPEICWCTLDEARRLIEWPSMRLRFEDLASFTETVAYRTYASDPFAAIFSSCV